MPANPDHPDDVSPRPLSLYTARPSRPETGLLLAVLILAAALRLGMPGVVEFKQDEANLSLMALDMARGHDFPLLGIDSSVGVRNAPVNVYILALPYLFSSDPVLATQYIGLLNVLAVLATYLLTRRYFGPLPALIAALFLATSPWAVMYSRKIWAQEMLPPFVVLSVGSGMLAFLEGKRWAQWAHLPLLAITGQIHYAAFVLIPITVYLVIAGRRRLTRAFWASIVLAGLAALPYAIGVLQASLLQPATFQRILAGRGESGGASVQFTSLGVEYAWITVGGVDIHAFAGPDVFRDYLARVPDAYPFFHGLSAMVALSAAWLIFRALRRRDARSRLEVALLLWLIVPILAFSFTWTPIYTHYLIPMYPAAFIVLGVGAGDAWRGLGKWARTRRIVATGVGILGAGTAVLQVWLMAALLIFLNSYATTGAFGVPLGYLMPIREAILKAPPRQVIGILGGQFIGYDSETTIWNFLLYDMPLRRFVDNSMMAYPPEAATILSNRCEEGGTTFSLRPRLDNGVPEGCYALRPLAAGSFDPAPFTPAPDAPPFANGLRLSGYRWAAETGCLETAWMLGAPAAGPKSDFFNMAVYFFDATDARILEADGPFWNGRYWRAGDSFTRTFCLRNGLERVNEIAEVGLGLYTFDDTPDGRVFYAVDVLDVNGAPAGQQIRLALH